MGRPEGLFVGLDLGGQEVKVGLGDGCDGRLAWTSSAPSRAEEGREAILGAIAAAVESARQEASRVGTTIRGVGLGTPGVVDPADGSLRHDVANLAEWRGVAPARFLEGRFGVPAAVDNDANVATLAEARFGAGRAGRTVLGITVGTGIGSGLVHEGRLFRGARGAAMELGHIPHLVDGHSARTAECGFLEAHAGGRGLRRAYRRALVEGGVLPPGVDEPEAAELRDLIRAAADGDSLARGILEDGADQLGIGLASAILLLNPDVLVLGGGVVDGVPWFAERAEASMRSWALEKALDGLAVRRARFGNRAGVLGAILLAREVTAATERAETE